jgi:preprotein translocase subunit SecE
MNRLLLKYRFFIFTVIALFALIWLNYDWGLSRLNEIQIFAYIAGNLIAAFALSFWVGTQSLTKKIIWAITLPIFSPILGFIFYL